MKKGNKINYNSRFAEMKIKKKKLAFCLINSHKISLVDSFFKQKKS